MIEKALRERIQPIVNRRRRLHLAWRLSVYWLVSGLIGIGLIGAYRRWGWGSPVAVWVLCLTTALVTAVAFYRSRRMQPDYKAAARNIEISLRRKR